MDDSTGCMMSVLLLYFVYYAGLILIVCTTGWMDALLLIVLMYGRYLLFAWWLLLVVLLFNLFRFKKMLWVMFGQYWGLNPTTAGKVSRLGNTNFPNRLRSLLFQPIV
jgi:hypothetical protein